MLRFLRSMATEQGSKLSAKVYGGSVQLELETIVRVVFVTCDLNISLFM